MAKKIKVAGYIRVSTSAQAKDGESLSTQQKQIKKFAKSKGWELTKVYSDEGISGGSVEKRFGLLQCLHDGQLNKFDILKFGDIIPII